MNVDQHRVVTGHPVDLAHVATRAPERVDRDTTERRFDATIERLRELQYLLHAEGRHRVLVVVQATDTGGKDGLIRNVFGELNPQGVRVANFKAPTAAELAHDYLWRIHPHVPADGELVVFNRSHYEDVLVVRVHGLVPEERWSRRYGHIADFERMLADEGTTIVKLFLHISKDEQAERLRDRLDDPTKNWKFNEADLTEREHWDDYQAAYAEMVNRTSTDQAPWYVVPADQKWYRNAVAAEIMLATLERLDMRYPEVTADLRDIEIV